MWISGYSKVEWVILSIVCLALGFLTSEEGARAVCLVGALVSFYIWLILTEKLKGFNNEVGEEKDHKENQHNLENK